MTKTQLTAAVNAAKEETREVMQIMYDALNPGQQKQIVKVEAVKTRFDIYGVEYAS